VKKKECIGKREAGEQGVSATSLIESAMAYHLRPKQKASPEAQKAIGQKQQDGGRIGGLHAAGTGNQLRRRIRQVPYSPGTKIASPS